MDKKKALEKLGKNIAKVANPHVPMKITSEDNLRKDLSLDDTEIFFLITQMEVEFGVQIGWIDEAEVETVGGLENILLSALKNK